MGVAPATIIYVRINITSVIVLYRADMEWPVHTPQIPPDAIRGWVRRNFPDYKERRNGEQLVICNPLVSDDEYHFNISTSLALCHDWRSDESWAPFNPSTGKYNKSFLAFVTKYKRCTYRQALTDILGNTQYKETPKSIIEPLPTVSNIQLPVGAIRIVDSQYRQMTTILYNWLLSRGVTRDDVRCYDLYHLGTDVIWPYYEYAELVYWQMRSSINKRFTYPPGSIGVTKGQFLYGYDFVNPASYLIITESIFDAHTLQSQALASGGADLTRQQVQKILDLNPRDGVILAPDNDRAGVKSIIRNGQLLLDSGLIVGYSIPPRLYYSKDGNNHTTKDWNELLNIMPKSEVKPTFERNVMNLNWNSLLELRLLG